MVNRSHVSQQLKLNICDVFVVAVTFDRPKNSVGAVASSKNSFNGPLCNGRCDRAWDEDFSLSRLRILGRRFRQTIEPVLGSTVQESLSYLYFSKWQLRQISI